MECNCRNWEENVGKIEACVAVSTIEGRAYNGKFFLYCPWCGEKLKEEE